MTATLNSGIDLTHVDADARPQDDLFGHVNGRWLADYAMPADRATDGAFRLLADRAEEQVRELITESADADAPAVARLREAGAIVFAQSTSSEYGHKGVTDSPLNGRRCVNSS